MYAFGEMLGGSALAAYTLVLLWKLYSKFKTWRATEKNAEATCVKPFLKTKDVKGPLDYIVPLPDFDWRATEPLKFRIFKSKYHLTMGLTTSTISELIEMDRNYLTRIRLRREIIHSHHDIAIQASPAIKPAVDELYTWLMNKYLPTRFPTMFTLHDPTLLNHVTNQHLPLTAPSDPTKTFELLGCNLDVDILLFLPSPDGDGYSLAGYVTCFPSGFNTKEKFGLKLKDIHGPVPGYKEKLEKSMDRFFDRLEVGKVVLRSNWSVDTKGRLYAASGGNHLYEGDEVNEEVIDVEDAYLRCERQMLHRLPVTKALVFSFKTYMYPLSEVKNEGLGEEMAQAVDGLKEGNVPGMHFYKRGVVWEEAVKAYLRS